MEGRDPALDRLDALVGEWTMEAGPPDGDPWPGEAGVSYEWLDGRTWLIQRWHVDMPEAPDGIALIGLADAPTSGEDSGNATAGFRQHYFDSRGVHRVYEMSLDSGEWKLWRDGPPFDQRFAGRFEDDGKTVKARWEIKEEGSDWRTDFDLTYRKIG